METTNGVKLSLCVVNTNNREKLARALVSIYQNPPKCEFEILVVDNASTDGSAEMVREQFPDVKLTASHHRRGYPANSNINMRKASGEYYLILNEDIEILPGSLDVGVQFMDEHRRVGMLGCCMLSPDGNVQFGSGRRFPSILNDILAWTTLAERFPQNRFLGRYLMSDWPHDTIRDVEVILEAGMLVRREAVDRVGMMDENLFFCYDGPDWARSFRQGGWQVVFHPAVRIIHHEGASSRRDGKPNYFLLVESLNSEQYYYEKHHGRWYALAHRLIMIALFSAYVVKHTVSGLFAPSSTQRASIKSRKETVLIMLGWYLGNARLLRLFKRLRLIEYQPVTVG
jgi:GT2 family glycosyltransferase